MRRPARSQLSSILAGLPSDGRLRYTNYGKGVIFWNSDSDAEQYVNDFQQVVSTDVYWFTEGDVCSQYQGGNLLGMGRDLTSAECHRASNYGAQVARVRALDAMDGKRMPVWAFVETGHPFDNNMGGGRSIAPAEVRAAVWHSIIAGARGIIYFQHSFGGSCVGDHHTIRSNCEGTRPIVVSTDAQIQSLAGGAQLADADSGVHRELVGQGDGEVERSEPLRVRRIGSQRVIDGDVLDPLCRQRNGDRAGREQNGRGEQRLVRRSVRRRQCRSQLPHRRRIHLWLDLSAHRVSGNPSDPQTPRGRLCR